MAGQCLFISISYRPSLSVKDLMGFSLLDHNKGKYVETNFQCKYKSYTAKFASSLRAGAAFYMQTNRQRERMGKKYSVSVPHKNKIEEQIK